MDKKKDRHEKRSLEDIFFMEEAETLEEDVTENEEETVKRDEAETWTGADQAEKEIRDEEIDNRGSSILKNRLSRAGLERLKIETNMARGQEPREKEEDKSFEEIDIKEEHKSHAVTDDTILLKRIREISSDAESYDEDMTSEDLSTDEVEKSFDLEKTGSKESGSPAEEVSENEEDILRARLLSSVDSKKEAENHSEEGPNQIKDSSTEPIKSLFEEKSKETGDSIFNPEETALFNRPIFEEKDDFETGSFAKPLGDGIKIDTALEDEELDDSVIEGEEISNDLDNTLPGIKIFRSEDLEEEAEASSEDKDDLYNKGTADNKAKAEKKRGPLMAILMEWVIPIAFAFGLAFIIKTYIGGLSSVQGHSMEPTLREGDMLYVDKLPIHFKNYKRGDILIIDSPDGVELYVKRLVGMPGETVEIKNGKVLIGGKWLKDSWTDKETAVYNNDKWVLGPDQYFVLGDNREEGASNDSRIFGPIGPERIEGVARLRIWPLSSIKGM